MFFTSEPTENNPHELLETEEIQTAISPNTNTAQEVGM